MTKTKTDVTLIEIFCSDEWSLYGLWHIAGVGDVGCVVGVPEYLRGTAAAAASWRGVTDAWFADSSDWSTTSERDAAIEVMRGHAYQLANATREELYAGLSW